jgi:hypothetical protein
MPKSKRGRPPKYEPMGICWRSLEIIRTLGVENATRGVPKGKYRTCSLLEVFRELSLFFPLNLAHFDKFAE